jgi:hypothetical protein
MSPKNLDSLNLLKLTNYSIPQFDRDTVISYSMRPYRQCPAKCDTG